VTIIFFEENRNAMIRDARCCPAAAPDRARTRVPIDPLRGLFGTFLDEAANDKNCAREISRAFRSVMIGRRSHQRGLQLFRAFSAQVHSGRCRSLAATQSGIDEKELACN
jgi:hypothetical protein